MSKRESGGAGEHDITRMLSSARKGDREAVGEVFDRVYREIRRIAHGEVRRLGAGATLNTTAVVHEAYLKLVNAPGIAWEDRSHFFAVAATAMRQILVDYARRRSAGKRGGRARAISLDDLDSSEGIAVDPLSEDLIALDTALGRLATLDDRLARVVDLRFFAGLSVEETALALGVTDRTVKRDWRRARAYLYNEIAPAAEA
jgi:RNA polymerase sigma factor (TIGR02999 family)